MQRQLLLVAILLLSSNARTASLVAQQSSPQSHPNVVLILMDDLGYGDLGSYGVPDARTPNVDRLAREGVRLTNAYANGAVCTPYARGPHQRPLPAARRARMGAHRLGTG